MAEATDKPEQVEARLDGWKEIAKYLGQSVRSVQRLEDKGLPVRRLPGAKSPVFTFKAELDGWQRESTARCVPKGPVPQADPNLVPTAGGAGKAEAVPAEAGIAPPSRKPRPFYAWLLLCLLVTPVLFYLAQRVRRKPVADFRIQGRDLVAVDARGQELWHHTFVLPLWESFYTQEVRLRFGWIGELEPRRGADLLFVAKAVNAKELGDTLYCFGRDGSFRWKFVPGRPVWDGTGSQLLPPYVTGGLQVIVGRSTAETRIAVSSNHYLEQPDQVAFLDVDGRVIGEYWHPGHLLHLVQADLDGDGRKELLLGGVNNGNHQATLVVLDPLKVSGLVTPKEMADHRFELLNMPAAREKAVILFPRSCISKGQPYTRVRAVHVTGDRVIVEVAEGTNAGDLGFVYEFDYGLNPVQVTPEHVAVMKRHQELESSHELDHRFSSEVERERLKAGLIVRRPE